MAPLRLLILLVGAVALCEASPARMFFDNARRDSRSLETVATVDCSNREAVKFVAKTNANFRCVYPDRNSRSSVARDAANGPNLFGNSPAGLQSASLTREDPSACAPGTMFVPEIGLCLEANKPKHSAPLQSGSLVIQEPTDEISSFPSSSHVASDCKPGEIYNSELSLCMGASKRNSGKLLPALNQVRESAEIAPLEIQSFASSISSASDCKDGEIYVSEINHCIQINPSPLKSANLVLDRPIRDSSTHNKPVTPKDCTENEIYVSEIGICLPHTPPKDRKPLVAGSLVHEEKPRPVAVPDTPKTCNDDEIYVPEIGICVPHDRTNKQQPPSSSSLVKEPEKLEITAFETSKNHDECPTGTHFVSEIGLCLN